MDKSSFFAVIGDPIAHSLSPVMQNAAFKALNLAGEYTAFHVMHDDLESFVQQARKNLCQSYPSHHFAPFGDLFHKRANPCSCQYHSTGQEHGLF